MGCNQLGMFSGATNAEEMNVSGNIQMKLAEFTASVEPTERPVYAWIQQNAYANANSRSVAATASAIEPSMRKPTRKATTSITTNDTAFRTTSLIVRP